MNRPKVFLAVPTYGGMEPLFVTSLLRFYMQHTAKVQRDEHTFDLHMQFKIGDSLVCRARNHLAADFLRSGCTHLLFLDSDLIFGLDQIERLVSHQKPIICGLYPHKKPRLEWVCNLIEGEEADERGLHPVRYAGTGCMLIAREVLDKMIFNFPDQYFVPEAGEEHGGWDLFRVGVHYGSQRYLSEDWFFCQNARDLGYTVLMDTCVVLQHIGTAVYPLENPFVTCTNEVPEPRLSELDRPPAQQSDVL